MELQLLERIRNAWSSLGSSRYVKSLENEVARLRAENRALMNSILGIAGIPPVVSSASENNTVIAPGASRAGTVAQSGGVDLASASKGPLHKRSWQQVNRMLELESSRKKDLGQNTKA